MNKLYKYSFCDFNMFSKLKKKISNYGVTRQGRIKNYISNVEDKFTLKNQTDKDIVKEINSLIDDRITRIERISIIEVFLFVAVYFSFFSIFISNFFILSEFAKFLSSLFSFFGTTIFLIGLFFTNRFKQLYYTDLMILTSHLVSIYSQNRFDDNSLFNETNSYNAYLGFFKKRGFGR